MMAWRSSRGFWDGSGMVVNTSNELLIHKHHTTPPATTPIAVNWGQSVPAQIHNTTLKVSLTELIDSKHISYRNTLHSAESALYERGRRFKLEETILLEEIERHGFSSRSRGYSRCTPRSRCEVLGKMPISISQMVSPFNHCRDVRD